MVLGLTDKKYIEVLKSGTTYNLIAVNVVKGGVTYNVWGASSTVTYIVDSGVTYSEDVTRGNSVLSPTSFTPSKSGWTFVGWREDSSASSSVLTSKTMGDNPITLYAVFKKTVSAKFISYNNAQTASGTAYYNNSNITQASVKAPTGATYSGWSWRGWGSYTNTSATASVAFANGASVAVHPDNDGIVIYGLYSKSCTLTAKSYNSTQYAYGTAYWNAYGSTANATCTVPSAAAYSGWSFRGWSHDGVTTANATAAYANGATFTLGTGNATVYGLYSQGITCTFKSYNSNQTSSGTRYYNAYGTTANASITVPSGATYSGWSWRGWSSAGTTGASASVSHSNGSTISGLSSGQTYYGLYSQTIYLYYNGNGASSGSVNTQSGTRYYNAYGNTSNPSFILASNGFSKTNYKFSKWAQGSTGGTQYSAGATVTLSASTTFYALWEQAVYNLGSYGTVTCDVTSDGETNGTNSVWKNGSTLVNCIGQKLTISFSFYRLWNDNDDWAFGSKLDVYLRNTSGARTYLGTAGQNRGAATESTFSTDLSSPKSFTLPSSGSYYVDIYVQSIGYNTGTFPVGWNVSNITIE